MEAARFTGHAGISEVVVNLAGVAVAGKTEAEVGMGFLTFTSHDCVEASHLLASMGSRRLTKPELPCHILAAKNG